jgi:hypothetical protein
LVAARDIAAGEIVFADDPFAVGACATDWLQCVGCFGKVRK